MSPSRKIYIEIANDALQIFLRDRGQTFRLLQEFKLTEFARAKRMTINVFKATHITRLHWVQTSLADKPSPSPENDPTGKMRAFYAFDDSDTVLITGEHEPIGVFEKTGAEIVMTHWFTGEKWDYETNEQVTTEEFQQYCAEAETIKSADTDFRPYLELPRYDNSLNPDIHNIAKDKEASTEDFKANQPVDSAS